MVGLAAQRRARNLPASVIDIGMVIGIGTVTKTEDEEGINPMETSLRKLDYMPVSERDIHHLLAEAILVGKSEESPELVIGLENYESTTGNNPFWHKNLRFSHLIGRNELLLVGHGSGQSVRKSLKEKLTDAAGPDDALQILGDALLTYLASSLKVSNTLISKD